MASSAEVPDWSSIPALEDDGGADHLRGLALPPVPPPAKDRTSIDFAALPGRTIVYAFPRTGRPDQVNPEGWNVIPSARSCSPQSCAFRSHHAGCGAWRRSAVRPLDAEPPIC